MSLRINKMKGRVVLVRFLFTKKESFAQKTNVDPSKVLRFIRRQGGKVMTAVTSFHLCRPVALKLTDISKYLKMKNQRDY